MTFNFKQFMFDNSLIQTDMAQIIEESQSVISFLVNGKRIANKRHLDLLKQRFGEEVIEQYMIDVDEIRNKIARQVPATIIPAEIVEEIKDEVSEAESIPILSEDLSTATDLDIRAYLDENGGELERINPSQMLQRADLAEKVIKTSMLPTFAPGDIVFVRFMRDKAKLVDGDTYYFDLKSRPTMIRKVKIEGDKLRLVALNPDYGDIVTDRNDIISVAKIIGLLRMTFADFYSDAEETRRRKDQQIENLIGQFEQWGARENRLIDIIEKRESLLTDMVKKTINK